jgi:hypothetical protein
MVMDCALEQVRAVVNQNALLDGTRALSIWVNYAATNNSGNEVMIS